MAKDRYSLNVVAVSISRTLSLIGGLVSSTILFRAILISWTYNDYATIKVLTNAASILSLILLMGLPSTLSRVVAEFSNDKEKLGQSITISIVFVTFTFIATFILVIVFGMQSLLLRDEILGSISNAELQIYWLLAVALLLPDAYLKLGKSAFKGVQQLRRSLYVDIVYNILRISALLLLFFQQMITLFTILSINLILSVISASTILYMLMIQMKRNGIPFRLKPSKKVVERIRKFAILFINASAVTAVYNFLSLIWLSNLSTTTSIDVSYFAIAQSLTITISSILLAPLWVMTPNLTSEFYHGTREKLISRFKDVYRTMVPLLGFAFLGLFAFSFVILRVLYGYEGVGAQTFLQIMSFNVIFVIIVQFYLSLHLAMDDGRAFLGTNTLLAIAQVVWIAFLSPVLGVHSITALWVVYIPVFMIQHFYSKRKHKIWLNLAYLIKGFIISLVLALGSWMLVENTYIILSNLIPYNIFAAGVSALLAIPLWMMYMILMIYFDIIDRQELDGFEKVLRIIPPAWWLSKPFITRLQKASDKTEQTPQDHAR